MRDCLVALGCLPVGKTRFSRVDGETPGGCNGMDASSRGNMLFGNQLVAVINPLWVRSDRALIHIAVGHYATSPPGERDGVRWHATVRGRGFTHRWHWQIRRPRSALLASGSPGGRTAHPERTWWLGRDGLSLGTCVPEHWGIRSRIRHAGSSDNWPIASPAADCL